MARFTIDGRVFDTEKSSSYQEGLRWDGRNHISIATGSQWEHETLYQSRKGAWWLVWWSRWQGTTPTARLLTKAEAAGWLHMQGLEVPPELESALADIEG